MTTEHDLKEEYLNEKYTVEKILDTPKEFSNFIDALKQYGIDNLSAPKTSEDKYIAYAENGIILVDAGKKSLQCRIGIADKPFIQWKRASPLPTTKDGDQNWVYKDGYWTNRGPWCSAINKVINNLLKKLRDSITNEKNLREEERRIKMEELFNKEQALTDAWKDYASNETNATIKK